MSKINMSSKPLSARAKPQSSTSKAAATQEGSITPKTKLLAANQAKAAAVKAKLAAVHAEAQHAGKTANKAQAAAQEDFITPKSKVTAANKVKAAAVKAKLATIHAEATTRSSQNIPLKKYTTEEREDTLLKAMQSKIESRDFSSLKSYIIQYNAYSLDNDKLSELLCKRNKFSLYHDDNSSPLEIALFGNINTELILSNVNATELEKVISVRQQRWYEKSILQEITSKSLIAIFKTHPKVGLTVLDLALNRHADDEALILNIIDRVSPEELTRAIVNAKKNVLITLMQARQVDKLIVDKLKLIIDKLSAENILEIQSKQGLNILDLASKAFNNGGWHYYRDYNVAPIIDLLCSIIGKIPPKLLAQVLFGMGTNSINLMKSSHEIATLITNKFSAENILEIQGKEGLNNILFALTICYENWHNPELTKLICTVIDKNSPQELTQALDHIKTSLIILMQSNEIAKLIIDKIPAENIPELLFAIKSSGNFIPCLEYCISLKTKVFNVNAVNAEGNRLIDIVSIMYANTDQSLLKTINDLRKLGSVEPKLEIKIETPKNEQKLDYIDTDKLDGSDKNRDITREVLRRIDNDYELTEAQVSENIDWFKTQDLNGWSNSFWKAGIRYTIPEVVDELSKMRNINDRLGVHWDFKKVLATAIHISRMDDDKEMIGHLTFTLSELGMCDLGKLINLASVLQTKFNKDIAAAQRPGSIEFNENEIVFLFQNVFDGLKCSLESDNNKLAQAIKSWIFEFTDKEVARDNPEKWSTVTTQIHGLFNTSLLEIISHNNLNFDTRHFKSLVDQIMLRINNIKSPADVSNLVINEWRKLYILSKELYFQKEFEKIVQNPDTTEDVFAEFSMNAKSYYGDLSGISHSVYAKVYKKLSDQNIESATQFLSTAIEYAFITQNDIEFIEQLAQDPSLFDDELALLAQGLLNASEEYKDEEVKEKPQFEDEYKYHEPMNLELLGLSGANEAAALDFSNLD